ncbi:MAG: major facilitator superfamily 1 [Frondihabitans sp.]|jgi:MFS family permease|nr:major facilitator superfamily 1 [Frondihabitans sp.]
MNVSTAPTPKRKMRSPWWVVIGGGIAAMFAPGPVALGTLGLFIIPITAENGWTRTEVTSGFSFGAIGMAIGIVIVGRLLDRFAIRYITIPSFIGFAIFLALMGTLQPGAMWFYYFCFFMMGLLGGGTSIPFSKAVVSWFDNKRGVAIGTMAGFVGLGQATIPLLAVALIASLGWRGAYPALAILVVIVATVVISLLVRVRAERSVRGRLVKEVTEEKTVVNLELPGLTLKQAVRGRHFWMIALSLGTAGVAIIGLQINIVPMMVDQGIAPAQAALLLTILGLSSLVGRVVGGFLIDRISGRILGCVVLLFPVVGLSILYVSPPFIAVAVAVFVIGIALGVENDLIAFFITRYLGTRNFGQIIGWIQGPFIIASAFGPLVFSLAYDTFGTYQSVFPLFGLMMAAGGITILFLGKYRYPALHGFDKVAAKDELAAAELLSEQAEVEDEALVTKAAEPEVTRSR